MYNDQVSDTILKYIDQQRHLFVFPSEVAGEFRQKEVLRRMSSMARTAGKGGMVKRAIRRDRFISWDRLKEREFSPGRTRQPANGVYRLLCAAELLDEHAHRGPLLQYLLGEGGEENGGNAGAGFQRQLALSLPQSQYSVEALDAHPDTVPPALEHDLRTLYTRYLEFLERAELFEPAFVPPQGAQPKQVYHIFYPELIEDYSEFRRLVEENEGFITYFSEPALQQARCIRFPTARRELEYVISSLNKLLDRGVHPGDIAISLPEYEAWAPYLAEEAEIRNIPLDFRSGRTLSEYPAGRLFTRISALSVNGFGLEHLKRIVLEPAYPLASADRWRELIGFAIDHFYVRSWKGDGAAADELDRKLKLSGKKELRSLYRNFRHQIAQLMEAPDFSELQKRVHKFIRTFFEVDRWDPETERVLQYCLMVVRELQEASEKAGGIDISDPYGLWITLLNQRIYVSAVRKEAVPVYPYRVSAGITPRYHFLPGAGQGHTRIRQEELSFLREDYRSLLLEREARDMSADFLSAYAQSGEQVVFSCSDLDFSGPQLPPGELLSAGVVTESGDSEPPEAAAASQVENPRLAGPWLEGFQFGEPQFEAPQIDRGDIFVQEEAYWAGSQDFPSRLYPVQQNGFASIRNTAFTAKGRDYSKEPVEDPELLAHLFKIARGRLGAEDGRFWFSPSSFDQYAGCPFQYLLNRGLKIGEIDYTTKWDDPLTVGTMLHRILSELCKRVQERDGRWKRENRGEYLRFAEEICNAEFDSRGCYGLDFIYPIWKELQRETLKALSVFVEQESKLYHGYELDKAEDNLHAEIDERCGIHGRVDRVSRKEGHAVIVDYKKGFAPRRAEVYLPDALPSTSQLPLYAYALEKEEYRVSSTAYYSVKKGEYKHMLLDPSAPIETTGKKPKPMVSPEEFQELKERIVSAVSVYAENLGRGVYRAAESCDGCEFRTVCRRKYNVRIPEVRRNGYT